MEKSIAHFFVSIILGIRIFIIFKNVLFLWTPEQIILIFKNDFLWADCGKWYVKQRNLWEIYGQTMGKRYKIRLFGNVPSRFGLNFWLIFRKKLSHNKNAPLTLPLPTHHPPSTLPLHTTQKPKPNTPHTLPHITHKTPLKTHSIPHLYTLKTKPYKHTHRTRKLSTIKYDYPLLSTLIHS